MWSKGYIANVVKQGEFIYNYDQLPNSLGSYLDFTNSQPLYNRYVQSTGDSSITMGSSNDVVLVKMAIVVINQNDLYWIMLLQHKYFIKLAVSTKNNSILTFDKIYILL